MKCIYCNKICQEVGKTTEYGGGTEYHYSCADCNSYFKYWNDHLEHSAIYFILNGQSYFIQNRYAENKTFVYTVMSAAKIKEVFSLNHIPNWSPTNVAIKVKGLIAFS